MRYQVFYRQTALRRTVVALALATAYSSSWALPTFTFNPSAVGLAGSAFTGDNLLTSDFSGVTFSDPTHFVDNGFLQVTSVQLGGSTFTPTGLDSTYGLWFRFQATGHLTTGTAATLSTAPSSGVFDTLTSTFSGNNGTQMFGATPAGGTCVSGCTGATLLANGSLLGGGVGSTMQVDPNTLATVFVPNAAATVSFAAASASGSFFQSPNPFYSVALSAFTNTISEITSDGINGFTITQGGGSINFASPIPEPDNYALMLGGLGVLGLIARRRRS